jgi:hypothetical protein
VSQAQPNITPEQFDTLTKGMTRKQYSEFTAALLGERMGLGRQPKTQSPQDIATSRLMAMADQRYATDYARAMEQNDPEAALAAESRLRQALKELTAKNPTFFPEMGEND